ncbi:MAG: NAD(P)H-hydrate dehydratase [Gammaproteobacteria bacterium]|nr:NAD(P)H-hydrate dehydratase [Gammaproteobacteria bacterium]
MTDLMTLPRLLYTAQQVRTLDRIAIEEYGLAGATLMARAGAKVFAVMQQCWPQMRSIVVCCGGGNNGGDGFVVARLARQAGLQVQVILLVEATQLRGDALQAYQQMCAQRVKIVSLEALQLGQADVIVDALLGTGLERVVEGPWRRLIEAINTTPCPVIAVDIPSGLQADSGMPLGCAIEADVTVTFIGIKQGLVTGRAADFCGVLIFDDLGLAAGVYAQVPAAATRIGYQQLAPVLLPRRRRSAHKGDFGHVLIIGGDHGMSGAVRMAAEAASRVGAGLVSVATREAHAVALSMACPEVMAHAVEHPSALRRLLQRATHVAIGPGLGRQHWGQQMLREALDCGLPLVVDADALNALADEPQRRDHWILTPHPGEAGRLLQMTTAEVGHDRYAAVRALQRGYGGVAVLKGAGTLLCDGASISVCCDGNPGMASGGMGDVLTGVIAGLWAQGLAANEAAMLGVSLHAASADRAARDGERGLLARDVIAALRVLVNPVG